MREAFVQRVLQASCIIVPSPPLNSVRERKGRKLSGSECSQWAGRSDSCYAVTEVEWLLSRLKSNYRIMRLLPGPHIEIRNLLW